MQAHIGEFAYFSHHDPEVFVEVISTRIRVCYRTLVLDQKCIALDGCTLLVYLQLQSLSHHCYRSVNLTIFEINTLHLFVLSTCINLHNGHLKFVLMPYGQFTLGISMSGSLYGIIYTEIIFCFQENQHILIVFVSNADTKLIVVDVLMHFDLLLLLVFFSIE